MRLEKMITFCGQHAKVACDAKCEKAWGHNGRLRVMVGQHIDDYAYLADDELGEAPDDPGTYEGGHAKPVVPPPQRTAAMMNKWCVRECERCVMSPPGEWNRPVELRDFSTRFYNIKPHKRAS